MKVTKAFIFENINDEFLNYDDTTRMYGNEPSFETALLHWLSKRLPEVKYILTEGGRLKRWSKKNAVDMLYNAAKKVMETYTDSKDFFNSGCPAPDDWFFNTYLVDGFVNSKVRAENISSARKAWKETGNTFPEGKTFIKV